MSLNILTLKIDNNFIQSPLAGYSDCAYRHIAIEHSCQITTTEMVSTEGLIRNSKKTFDLMRFADNEKNIVVQLFGSKKESFVKSCAVIMEKIKPVMIDINAGCPVRKVMKTGAGCAMMADLKNTYDIVHSIKNEFGDNLLLSIKFRLGISEDKKNYMDFASCVLDAGADVMSLHTRTAKALYSGKADMSHILALREKFKDAKIFASGDIFDIETATKAIDFYKADAALIARGGIGNPFIFEKKKPTEEEKIKALEHHFELLEYYFDRRNAALLIRKFLPFYLKGIPSASRIKEKYLICENI